MKKKMSLFLASALAVSSLSMSLIASAEYDSWFYNHKPYTIETENFSYANASGVTPKNDVECNANFMITGVYSAEDANGEPLTLYTVICYEFVGRGILYSNVLKPYMDNADDLNVGDLLYINNPCCLSYLPQEFYIDKYESVNPYVNYLGNGLDILGDEFMQVMRHEACYDNEIFYHTKHSVDNSRLEIVMGDATEDEKVNILDVITVTKSVLGRETLSGYSAHVSDVDQNGTIDSNDSLNVLKYVVGLTDTLDIVE